MIYPRILFRVAATAVSVILIASSASAQTEKVSDTGTSVAAQDESIRPFHVDIPESQLTDLRQRIAATHWPDKETVADTSQGVQLATMQKLA